MTAIATSITTPRRRVARLVLHRVADLGGSALERVAYAWTAFVEAGQLGPIDDARVSRHTGGRI